MRRAAAEVSRTNSPQSCQQGAVTALPIPHEKPTDPLLCAPTAPSTSELFLGITGDNSHNTPLCLGTDSLSLSSNLNEEKLPCLHLYE